MSKNTHRALALFAAAALTTSSLVACAPRGVVRTSSQNTPPSATSQPNGNANTTQTEQKPTENTSSTSDSKTNSQTTSNSQPTSSSQTNSQPTSTSQTSSNSQPTSQPTSNSQTQQTNATSTNTSSAESAPSQTGITGWLSASCREGSNKYGPDVTSATLSGETLTLEGDMAYSETGPASSFAERSTWISGPITLTVDESTRWEGRGGLAAPTEVEPEKVLHVVNTHGGLGLVIEAENGVAKTIAMCS